MNAPNLPDALASPRVAAEMLEILTAQVDALIRAGTIKVTTIRGRKFVSLVEVEWAVGPGGRL
jgi:hypothetical protein